MEEMKFSFDASSERTADIGCKPVWLMNLPGGLCLWMQKALNARIKAKSVLISVKNNKFRVNPCSFVVQFSAKSATRSAAQSPLRKSASKK